MIREADTPQELFEVVTVHGGIFNEIHACTSLMQLAKKKSLFTQDVAKSATFNDLLAFLEYQVAVMEPRALANTVWSLAQLHQKEEIKAAQLTATVAECAKGAMRQFQAADLSNLVWGLAQLRHNDAALMRAVARQTCRIRHTFQQREVVSVAWGFAKMMIYDEELMEALAQEVTGKISRWSAAAMATFALSFTRLNQTHRGLTQAITSTLSERSWPDRTARDWFDCAKIVLAAARAGACDPRFLDRISQRLDREVLSTTGIYDIAAMLWACKRLGCRASHPELFRMLQEAKDRRGIGWEDVEHESLLDPLEWIERLEEKQARREG